MNTLYNLGQAIGPNGAWALIVLPLTGFLAAKRLIKAARS